MYKHNYPLKKNYLTFREQKALSTLEHSEIIRTSEAHTYLKQANETLSQLVKKGHFIRLKKGLLISKEAFLQRPYEVVSKAMKGVVSYISALHLHGILEYEPNVIYIQVESRPFETSIGKYTIKATTTTHKFGLVQQEGIFVTDTEKTLLDCLSHPTRAGGYTVIARALKESKLNWKRLLEYLELFDKGSLYQKLGYLLTKTGKKTPRYVLRELKTHVKNNCRLVSDTSTATHIILSGRSWTTQVLKSGIERRATTVDGERNRAKVHLQGRAIDTTAHAAVSNVQGRDCPERRDCAQQRVSQGQGTIFRRY